MPRLHRPRRLPQRLAWLTRRRAALAGVLLLVLLSLVLAAIQPGDLVDLSRWLRDLPARLRGWAWQVRWLWPWLVALAAAAPTRPWVRRWWTSRSRPVRFGCVLAVVVLGLGVAGQLVPGLLVLGALTAVGLLAVWVLVVPARLAPPLPSETLKDLSELERQEKRGERARLQNELRATPLQFIVGLAVLAGAVLGFQQLTEDRQQATAERELARRGQVSERFTRAIDQLGSDRTETQIGGIYGLEQIAQQEPDNRLAVTEVLVAYVRPRVPNTPDNSLEPLATRAPDVHAALTVLGRRHVDPDDPRLDLRGLDLTGAFLNGADLTRADLRGVVLTDAVLRGADLSGAALNVADLSGAWLDDADLSKTFLNGADLTDTVLSGADLSGAVLTRTDLTDADLTDTVLSGADLSGADLSGAVLGGTDLRGAWLDGADLEGVPLSGALLEGAVASGSTNWPDGFDWRAAGVTPI